MSHARLISSAMLLACVFLVVAAVAGTAANDQSLARSTTNIQTSLQPDLTLKSTVAADLVQTAAVHRRGFCRCSCGYPCTSSADCGGASCDPFITCCDRGETQPAFQQMGARSTRTAEEQAVTVNLKCK
jgi:hypothetical protein